MLKIREKLPSFLCEQLYYDEELDDASQKYLDGYDIADYTYIIVNTQYRMFRNCATSTMIIFDKKTNAKYRCYFDFHVGKHGGDVFFEDDAVLVSATPVKQTLYLTEQEKEKYKNIYIVAYDEFDNVEDEGDLFIEKEKENE